MSDYYMDSLVQVVQWLRNGSVTSQVRQLNRCQCNHLQQRLLETLILFQTEFESIPSAKKPSCKRICEELYQIVKHAECLLRDCSTGEQGLNAAIRLAGQREAFVKILFELQWCMTVMRTVVRLSEGDISGDLQLEILKELSNTDWISKQKEMRCQIKEAAAKDQEELRHKLENLQRERNNPEQERRVADKLLERLSAHADLNKKNNFLFEIESAELKNTDVLGRGSFGSVYKTTWLGESYARKQFEGIDNESFHQEAAVLSGLCHPHVVQLFGRSVETKGCSLVMEVMSDNLQTLINTRKDIQGLEVPFEFPVALDIVLQIAEGMQYLHAQRVAHRDLKPSNILYTPVHIPELAVMGYVHAKIADFGLAKTKDSSTAFSTGTLNIGTTRYMAPELFDYPNHFTDDGLCPEKRSYPLKGDVYSYAITAFQILTGIEAYSGVKMVDLKRLVKYQGLRPELPAGFPQLLTSLMKRCWDADACKRPSFVQICLELRHLKGLLMLGRQLEALSFSIHPGEEESKRASPYQAYLTAASSFRDEATTGVTRVLVVGYKGAGKTDLIKTLCGVNQDFADDDQSSLKGAAIPDMNREWTHPSLPLVIHNTKDLGHNAADIDRIAQFLKQRNSGWTYDALQAVATKVLRRSWLPGKHGQDLENLNHKRIHLVWFVYSVLENPQTEWKPLMDVIRRFELPVQLLITNTEHDPSGEKLKKNYLDKRGYLFAPNIPLQEQILTVSSDCTASTSALTTVIEEENLKEHQEIRCVENVNAEQLWATSQVVMLKRHIQQTVKIICRLAFRLRKNGTTIASAPFTTLDPSYSLSQSAVFTLKCLCKIWEVPRRMETVLLDSLVSWECDESFNRSHLQSPINSFKEMGHSNSELIRSSSADQSRQLKLERGRFLGFVIRIASLVLFCKARHLKGWVQEGHMSDRGYSLEVNSYYDAYSANFKEFDASAHHFGVLAQIKGKLRGHSTKQALEERLQESLEGFFEDVLNRSPEPSPVVTDKAAVGEVHIPHGGQGGNEGALVTSPEPVVAAAYRLQAAVAAAIVQRWTRLHFWGSLPFWIVGCFFQSSKQVMQMCLRRSRSDSSLGPLV